MEHEYGVTIFCVKNHSLGGVCHAFSVLAKNEKEALNKSLIDHTRQHPGTIVKSVSIRDIYNPDLPVMYEITS